MNLDLEQKNFQHIFWLINIALSTWYLFEFQQARGIWFLLVSLSLVLSIMVIPLSYLASRFKIDRLKVLLPTPFACFTAVILALLAALLPFITPWQIFLHQSGRLLFTLWVCGFGAFLVSQTNKEHPLPISFLFLLLIAGAAYRIGVFIPDIQSVPFSLGWSEASRYYNASLFFDRQLYGMHLPLPVLHPSRYLLQSLPFLFVPGSILFHRLWQVLLWVGMTFLGSFALTRRFRLSDRFPELALTLWLFLFFFQGAVYFHLMICVILVLLGFNTQKPLRTLLFVVLASVWAGLSRLNWYPVPALLAVSLYLIEQPVGHKRWYLYLKYPILWSVLGGLAAFLTNQLYMRLSGNDPSQFTSSLSSLMIWSRLLPNASYPLGILFGLFIVSLPLVVAVLMVIRANGFHYYWQWIRSLGLMAILFVFLVGGIFVSVKVGGGGDLHNMDAFLVFLVVIALHVLLGHYTCEMHQTQLKNTLPKLILLLLVLVPVFFAFEPQSRWGFMDANKQQPKVELIQAAIDMASKENSDVLFISEKQLLTFNYIKGVRLDPDYEKVMLMEMVMSNNQTYLAQFLEKLESHTYAVIVTDSVQTHKFDDADAFGIENNLWVDKVTIPLLENYTQVFALNEGEVNVLVPNGQEQLLRQLKRLQRQSY